MKKISLKNLNLKEVEQLSREQLKNVLGGYANGTGGDNGDAGCPNVTCSTSVGVGEGDYCANDNKSGKCGYRHGIWGCDASTSC